MLTDPRASPTGYPFKVVRWGDAEPGQDRRRVCDIGYLRTPYVRDDGRVGYRCSSEPVEAWVKKGGAPAEAVGRRCLCNALMALLGAYHGLNPAMGWLFAVALGMQEGRRSAVTATSPGWDRT